MTYESVDQLQKVLVDNVFQYAKDSKKAAGRALGTLVEIITFYLLKSWGFEYSLSIERRIPEYGNPEITHNVEYSLHPVLHEHSLILRQSSLPITSTRIFSGLKDDKYLLSKFTKVNNTLLSKDQVLRNSCITGISDTSHLVANLQSLESNSQKIAVIEQYLKPYSIFECKRVGVEDGMRKGPQTIEKAKQGAYVAKSITSMHKIRLASGELRGLVYKSDGTIYSKPYTELIAEIVASSDHELLQDFVLTVGVVSNHGNWFTSENHNKELKVLSQSYDWLIFLTDAGISEFVTELLLDPKPLLNPAKEAFLSSYYADKIKNQFTKVQMGYAADQVLQAYFIDNKDRIEDWFNVISPVNSSLEKMRTQLSTLRDKDWSAIHGI